MGVVIGVIIGGIIMFIAIVAFLFYLHYKDY